MLSCLAPAESRKSMGGGFAARSPLGLIEGQGLLGPENPRKESKEYKESYIVLWASLNPCAALRDGTSLLRVL